MLMLLSQQDIDALIYRQESNSKYYPYWLELKYTHYISINTSKPRLYVKAINELKAQDHFYLQYCLYKFGTPLKFKSNIIKDQNKLEIFLINPNKGVYDHDSITRNIIASDN